MSRRKVKQMLEKLEQTLSEEEPINLYLIRFTMKKWYFWNFTEGDQQPEYQIIDEAEAYRLKEKAEREGIPFRFEVLQGIRPLIAYEDEPDDVKKAMYHAFIDMFMREKK